ncbi:MAG: insulinase family protein [Alphaproteobacteria bacterium]|nr:insulinase family protein [Alphaproteobacteria bacterium]
MKNHARVWPEGLFRVWLGALLFAASAALAPAFAQAAPEKPLWAHLASDIATDPAVTFGVLPNGMRYALMQNRLPPGAVSMRLALDFGSLHEADDERGLAHFIEHMAFNGSRNVAEGEMVRILERLGLAFGADTNAQTSQTHTTYKLDLPNAGDELIGESLMLLREVASELTFDAEAIERERGVVLAEHRQGDTFARRRAEQQLEFLIPGAYAASRMPIGDAQVIATAKRETFVSLYECYYRPERAVLVIVGDIDVKVIEAEIASRFGDWTGRGAPGAEPDLGYMPGVREPAASAFTQPEGGDSIAVYSLSGFEDMADTTENRRDSNLLSFATGAMNRRFARLANGEAPPFRSAGLSSSDVLEAADVASGSVAVTPESWKPGLQALEQEWRRALLHGFTADEIAEQVASLRTSVANGAQRESTRTTGQLVDQLTRSVLDDQVFATPSSGLARFEGWAREATPEAVQEVFRQWLGIRTPLFFMASSVPRPGVEEEIVAAWKESAAVAVTAPAGRSATPFAYTDFGRPGVVVRDTRLADIDTRTLTFANNVRLNIKRTGFQKNVVQVSVRVGGGELALPEKPFGLDSLMSAYAGGGLVKHSDDDLRNVLSGRAVQSGFQASATAFGGSYNTTPADLLLQLQVAAAYLTAPGYRPDAERRWRQGVVLSWPRFDSDPAAVLRTRGMRILASGDKRFGSDPDDGAVSRSFTELRGYLEPLLRTGAIEIAIVGDVEEEAAIRAVARTFGALPQREAVSTLHRSDRPVTFRRERAPLTLTHTGEPAQAIANVYWPVDIDPDADPQAARVVSVLASVMRLKVIERVREALGASYSPSAGASLSSVYPGWGYLSAGTQVKPEDADRVILALESISAELRAGGISADEFQRAITPALEQLPRNSTSNGYWLSLIAQAQGRPDQMARGMLPAVEASVRTVTIADLVAAANRWLKPEAALEVRVLPAAAAP